MDDNKGDLSNEQLKKARAWIEEHIDRVMHCPMCGRSNWTMSGSLVILTTFSPEGATLLGTGQPQLPLNCTYCAHTVLFNAIMVGLIAPDAAAEAGKENQNG